MIEEVLIEGTLEPTPGTDGLEGLGRVEGRTREVTEGGLGVVIRVLMPPTLGLDTRIDVTVRLVN